MKNMFYEVHFGREEIFIIYRYNSVLLTYSMIEKRYIRLLKFPPTNDKEARYISKGLGWMRISLKETLADSVYQI